jgi:hypothetical protein
MNAGPDLVWFRRPSAREEEPVYKQRVTSDIGSPFLLRATDIEHAANVARIALGFQSDGEHDHVHWDAAHEVSQRVFGSDNDFPSSDGWMDGPVRHLDYTSANKMNTTRFSSIVALRYCHSAR